MVFKASLMLIILQGSLVVTVKTLETCRLETDDANSVPELGDCIGDKNSFRYLLAINYVEVNVTTHRTS